MEIAYAPDSWPAEPGLARPALSAIDPWECIQPPRLYARRPLIWALSLKPSCQVDSAPPPMRLIAASTT